MKRRIAALVLLAAAAGLAWRVTPLSGISADDVVAALQSFAGRPWALPAAIAIYVPAQLVFFPLPLLSLAAMITFGPWVGFVCAMTGVLVAALAGYGAGRALKRSTVRRVGGPKLTRVTRALRRQGLAAITAVRLVPVAPFLVESLVAGALRIKVWHFVVGTLIGALPGTLASAFVGDQIGARLRGAGGLDLWLLVAGLIAIVIATWLGYRWLARRHEGSPRHARAQPLRTSGAGAPVGSFVARRERPH